MTIFADASALIALIAREADALTLADCLASDLDRLFSGVSGWETVAGLCRSYGLPLDTARRRFELFRGQLGLRFVPMGEHEYELAVDAYARFGKGRHPAALNMGDCHAYACAKASNARLLFKGEDFAKTDIEPALRT